MNPIFRKLLCSVALLGHALLAQSEEVRVLAAGAAKHALEHLAADFERSTGHRLQAHFDTVGAQRDRVLAAPVGAVADVVILSDAAMATLSKSSKLGAAAPVSVGQVVVALAVPQPKPASAQNNAIALQPLPPLRDADDLRQLLLASPRIAYADPARGATAGTHFAQVLGQLGLREELAPRLTVLPFGVDVITAVAQGRYDLGVSQSSEIVPHADVRFVGGLPPPYARATGYSAAMVTDKPGSRALLSFLGSDLARQTWRASGFVDR